MRILVCYDVSTETAEGRKRLRQVARVCVNHGQRVQKSVFECVVTEALLESFRQQLLSILSPTQDNLRLYRISENLESTREVFGICRDIDFDGPLVV